MERGKNYDFSRDIFPAMLRDGRADLRARVSGLLERHRQPATVPAGQLRRALGRGAGGNSGDGDSARRLGRRRTPHLARCLRARAGLLGTNVTIEAGAVVEELTSLGSIVDRRGERTRASRRLRWEDVYVGEGASLTGCTLADRVIVKDRVTIMEGAVIGRGSHARQRSDGSGEHQIVAGQVGGVGFDRFDVADLRHQVARIAVRRRRR